MTCVTFNDPKFQTKFTSVCVFSIWFTDAQKTFNLVGTECKLALELTQSTEHYSNTLMILIRVTFTEIMHKMLSMSKKRLCFSYSTIRYHKTNGEGSTETNDSSNIWSVLPGFRGLLLGLLRPKMADFMLVFLKNCDFFAMKLREQVTFVFWYNPLNVKDNLFQWE